jgi:hypothetical protein
MNHQSTERGRIWEEIDPETGNPRLCVTYPLSRCKIELTDEQLAFHENLLGERLIGSLPGPLFDADDRIEYDDSIRAIKKRAEAIAVKAVLGAEIVIRQSGNTVERLIANLSADQSIESGLKVNQN